MGELKTVQCHKDQKQGISLGRLFLNKLILLHKRMSVDNAFQTTAPLQ